MSISRTARSRKKVIKKKSVEHKLLPKRLPTSGRFAEKIGVNRATVYEWMKAHKEFFDAYMIAKEILKENSTDIGLAGAAPPPSFIFVAANLTDMKVQSNVDHTTGLVQFEVTVLQGSHC